MKSRVDIVIQPRSVTFRANFEISEAPIDIEVPLTKKMQRQLESAGVIGHRLLFILSSVEGVTKILISKHELEVILDRLCDQSLERALTEPLMEALAAVAKTKPEFVIVTREAGEDDIEPIDPPRPEE